MMPPQHRYLGRNFVKRSLLLTFVLASCAVAQAPPEMQTPSDGDAAAKNQTHYFLASQVDWVPLLPAPPAADSAAQQRDVQAVLDIQAKYRKDQARRQQAIDDSDASCFRFADVLGATFDEKKLPKTAAFLKTATGDGGSAAGTIKTYWKRSRPYIVSAQVEKLADMDPEYVKRKEAERKAKEEQERKDKAAKEAASGKLASAPPRPDNKKSSTPEEEKKKAEARQKEQDTTSYPSGHSTFGSLCSILLSQMVPEKQAELFARAEVYRESRMIVGAHFRTDIEAGKLLATAVAAVMSQNYAFQRDETEARDELRQTLGLPVTLPTHKTTELVAP